MQAAMPTIDLPTEAELKIHLEVSAKFNVTAPIAQQKANQFLLLRVGNMLSAGQPELLIQDPIQWRMPVLFSTPSNGSLGKVGELCVHVETGEVRLIYPNALEEMEDHAERLSERSALHSADGSAA